MAEVRAFVVPRRDHRAYLREKERVRAFVHARIARWNAFYGFALNRIFIKNHKRRWGSCSEKRNLNFSYRIIFLPAALADYVIVHELCHLAELNHSPEFWALVAATQPEYRAMRRALRNIR